MSYNTPFVSSAPGKVILFGEHAVVYGKLAIAASINLRTYVYYQPEYNPDSKVIVLACPDINYTGSWLVGDLMAAAEKFKLSTTHRDLMLILSNNLSEEDTNKAISNLNFDVSWAEEQVKDLIPDTLLSPQKGAVVVFLCLLLLLFSSSMGKLRGFSLAVLSKLPVGAGLGSSASFAVSLSGGLLNLFTHGSLSDSKGPVESTTLLLVNRLGYLAEKILHGNPSGVDNTVATYGGFVSYQGGIFECLGGLSALNILLTNSKVPRNTKQLVAGVKRLRDQFPTVVDTILEAINEIAKTLKHQLQNNLSVDELFGQIRGLININQSLLQSLGVSHSSLEKIVSICREKDQLSTKLTGAGGGGCTFTLLPSKYPSSEIDNLCQNLHHHGFETYPTTLGGVGLHVEKTTPEEITSALKGLNGKVVYLSSL